MDNKTDNSELISALADGELLGEALDAALRAAAADSAGRDAWAAYHVIGDVLRSGDLARATPSGRFLAGVKERLAKEAPLHAPVPAREAANDATFRWKLAAGFASFAAVAAIGWNVAGSQAVPAGAQLAAAPAAAVPVAAASGDRGGVMIRDARLDRLLAAHRQLGGATALQNPTGFMRNATFEGPAR